VGISLNPGNTVKFGLMSMLFCNSDGGDCKPRCKCRQIQSLPVIFVFVVLVRYFTGPEFLNDDFFYLNPVSIDFWISRFGTTFL
jgi:hypothetical protein